MDEGDEAAMGAVAALGAVDGDVDLTVGDGVVAFRNTHQATGELVVSDIVFAFNVEVFDGSAVDVDKRSRVG